MELSTEDYIAIRQTYARYAWGVDTGDLDTYISTWAEDGEYVGFREGKPHAKGHEEIRALAAAAFADPAQKGYHWNANVVIEPSEFGARGRCYLLHVLAQDAGTGKLHHALHYEDELVKHEGQWRFRRRNTHAL